MVRRWSVLSILATALAIGVVLGECVLSVSPQPFVMAAAVSVMVAARFATAVVARPKPAPRTAAQVISSLPDLRSTVPSELLGPRLYEGGE